MTRAAPGGRAHEVRIVGGAWKRSKLPVLDRPGLRPTPDRVRETLFNWLGQDLQGWQVLDAFAGSGALGFEAASRGAARVVCVERDASLLRQMAQSRDRLKATAVELIAGDALAWMGRAPSASLDLVLLDPPFDAGLHAGAIARALPLLKPDGFLYVEADRELEAPGGWRAFRHMRAGKVHALLWRKAMDSAATLDASPAAPSPATHIDKV